MVERLPSALMEKILSRSLDFISPFGERSPSDLESTVTIDRTLVERVCSGTLNTLRSTQIEHVWSGSLDTLRSTKIERVWSDNF
jgi:hypothetical protein